MDLSATLAQPLQAAIQPWQNFYLLTGTAAATLIGLMFIAVTFGASIVKNASDEGARAFIDPTYSHFFQVLVTACVLLIPSLAASVLGWLVVVGSVVRIGGVFWVYMHFRRAHRLHGDIEAWDWAMAVVLPMLAFLLLLASGVGFLQGRAVALDALAVVTIAVLSIGVRSAWELLVWMVIEAAGMRQRGADDR